MNAQLKTERGKSWLEVQYDPGSLDWDSAIRVGLATYGLRPGQLPVIATPIKREVQRDLLTVPKF